MKIGIIPWPAPGHVMNRWRYDVLIKHLPAFGHHAEYCREDGEYDCAIIPLLPENDKKLFSLKKRAPLIVGDITDELFSFPFERYTTLGKIGLYIGLLLRGNRPRHIKMVRSCDCVVVGCNSQKASVARYNPNVAAITDAITDDIFDSGVRYEQGEKCRIVWLGNTASLHGLTILEGLFDKLAEVGGYELVIITSDRQAYGKWLDKYPRIIREFISWSSKYPRGAQEFVGRQKIPCRFVNWEYDTCAKEASFCDVGVVPVGGDSEWIRNKPAGRVLFFMALGLPVVASPVESHREVLKPAHGFLAERTEDWLETIQKLRNDAALRKEIGSNARGFVRDNFGERQFAGRYASIIDGLQRK
jgi:hypothetical protein